jgi:tetratricopeptide (TPR) repeat protein
LTILKNDKYGKSRRRSLQHIAERFNKLPKDSFVALELQVRIWKQKARESRTRNIYLKSVEGVQRSFDELFQYSMNASQELTSTQLLVNWTVDFSRTAGASVDVNKLVALLNKAIKYLGIKIGLDSATIKASEKYGLLLCLRAKCRRALASLLQKRVYTGRTSKAKIRRIKDDALQDAERAYKLWENGVSKLELALCLFSISFTTETETAKRAMTILREAHEIDSNVAASYELVKQLRMRHIYKETIEIFAQAANNDSDRRRFHENVTFMAASVIGLYYENKDNDEIIGFALDACSMLEEVISHDHHTAREIVDLCYIKAICGFPVDDSVKILSTLKASSEIPWEEIANMAQKISIGEDNMEEALMLALENSAIWSKIGTFFSDFCSDYEKAIDFYNYASQIDPSSPVYYFNKARIFAYNTPDYNKGKAAIDYALHLTRNKYGWYKNNKNEIMEVKAAINNLTCGST